MPYVLKRTNIDGSGAAFLGTLAGQIGWYADFLNAWETDILFKQQVQRWRILNDTQTKIFRVVQDVITAKYRMYDIHNRMFGILSNGSVGWRQPTTVGFTAIEFDTANEAGISNWAANWARRTPSYINYNYEIEST